MRIWDFAATDVADAGYVSFAVLLRISLPVPAGAFRSINARSVAQVTSSAGAINSIAASTNGIACPTMPTRWQSRQHRNRPGQIHQPSINRMVFHAYRGDATD
ncbi:hypothetical protein F6P93_12675 [Escherichia coli]|nr:hypothetical protein F6P93_12675 [Escherichia coli]